MDVKRNNPSLSPYPSSHIRHRGTRENCRKEDLSSSLILCESEGLESEMALGSQELAVADGAKFLWVSLSLSVPQPVEEKWRNQPCCFFFAKQK